MLRPDWYWLLAYSSCTTYPLTTSDADCTPLTQILKQFWIKSPTHWASLDGRPPPQNFYGHNRYKKAGMQCLRASWSWYYFLWPQPDGCFPGIMLVSLDSINKIANISWIYVSGVCVFLITRICEQDFLSHISFLGMLALILRRNVTR